jgi:non-ribosomal peptide synthetase component E (peptide arylation enzyme)
LRDGFTAPTVAQLGEFLLDYGLAKFKWPERIEVLASFPLSASGKLSKEKLREIVKENVERERAQQAN